IKLNSIDPEVAKALDMPRALAPLRPTLLRTWGSFGTGAGQFNTPSGGSSPKSDLVFISDTRNHRIQVFDRFGKETGLILGGYGTEDGKLNLPTDLQVDRNGTTLFVVEAFNQRVSAFDTATGNSLF